MAIPDEAYREAAEKTAALLADDWYRASELVDLDWFCVAVDVGIRFGRTLAARAIRDHADEHFPADEEPYAPARRTFRRHLLAAARIADNPVTPEQAAKALRSGNVIYCRAEDIEGAD